MNVSRTERVPAPFFTGPKRQRRAAFRATSRSNSGPEMAFASVTIPSAFTSTSIKTAR